MSYTAPVDDILYTLREVAGAAGGMGADDLRAIVEAAGRFAADVIAPLNRVADIEGAQWQAGAVRTPAGFGPAYRAWAEAGWNGAALSEDWGGMGLPTAVGTAVMEMSTSACTALSTLPVLNQGASEAIAAHGADWMKALYLPKMAAGVWTGTMNLTEPQAGSDLGLLRATARPEGGGRYRIKGQKIFITFGEHDLAENIVHLVLARLPDAPPGTRGLSLFLVPKFIPDADGRPGVRNDVRCAGIEHKLGIKASPTCTMVFGDDGGAIGWLVGEENKGLACMFTMMNKARLATGLQGVALAERATQAARAYANERRQGRAAGIDGPALISAHPDVQRMLARMRSLTAAARAIAYRAAAAIDAGEDLLAGVLTPVVKSFCTDCGVEVTSLGIQIHGGLGFIEETGMAQHWRDSRIAPIYEGTNGIQAIDLVTRKLAGPGLAALSGLVEAARRDVADASPRLDNAAPRLERALDDWQAATAWITAPHRADGDKLYVASAYLRLFALALGGALLARGAAAGSEKWTALARVFAEDVAVESGSLRDAITSGSRNPADYAALAG